MSRPAAPLIYVLNGPNLNLLGEREPEIYGRTTLAQIDAMVAERAVQLGMAADCRQSNREGEIVDWLQEARTAADGVILNAAAYSHTSVAILDAALALPCPLVEVHLSNLFKRESVRHHSFVSQAALGVICGFGPTGYRLALDVLAERLAPQPPGAPVAGTPNTR